MPILLLTGECDDVDPQLPLFILDSSTRNGSYVDGELVVLACISGYVLSGQISIHLSSCVSGIWEPPLPLPDRCSFDNSTVS